MGPMRMSETSRSVPGAGWHDFPFPRKAGAGKPPHVSTPPDPRHPPDRIRAVAVFCGSSPGHDPRHAAAARALGEGIARAGLTLVFGGGGLGLMGEVAHAATAAGGKVLGVVPRFLMHAERPYPALAALEVVDSMHARKQRMFELADAFVALSGGIGTLDEFIEMLTWKQLGLHGKPIIVLDVAAWAQPLLALLEHLHAAGFLPPGTRALYQPVPDVLAALRCLREAPVPAGPVASDRL